MEDILLIDDQEITRIGLKRLFMDTFAQPTFGEANNVRDGFRLASDRDWDLVVLEVAMEQNSGLSLLEELKRERPKLQVLVVTVHSEEHYALRALRAGAAGYVTSLGDTRTLAAAARQVMKGGRYVSPTLAEALSMELWRNLPESVHELLSNRELQILRLLGAGKTVGEIAQLLAISDKTVSTYRARILEKTGMKSNAELVRYTVEHKLSSSTVG